MNQPPPDRDPQPNERDGTDDEAPDTPPTEPRPVPVEEPPQPPGEKGPYVVRYFNVAALPDDVEMSSATRVGSAGFVRWWENPAARVRSRSAMSP